jgi:hypothetical protein
MRAFIADVLTRVKWAWALIVWRRLRQSIIVTTHGAMDESELQWRVDVLESTDKRVQSIEYCPRECTGEAHATGRAERAGCFCPNHVSRSVHVQMKRWPEGGIDGFTASF